MIPPKPDPHELRDESEFGGLPPKSTGEIRSSLKSIMMGNFRDDMPGPLQGGLENSEWIVVESYPFKKYCNDLIEQTVRDWLGASRIDCRVYRRNKRIWVEVQMWDLDAAKDVLNQMPLIPDMPPELIQETVRTHAQNQQAEQGNYAQAGSAIGLLIGIFLAFVFVSIVDDVGGLSDWLKLFLFSGWMSIIVLSTFAGKHLGRMLDNHLEQSRPSKSADPFSN